MHKNEQFLKLCDSIGQIFSTCGKRQYGCVIVDERHTVLAFGYNGSPAGYPHCKDGHCPRLAEGSAPGSDYGNCFSCHAEANALLRSNYHERSAGDTILYVNGPPCWECSKLICGSGIKKVVCYYDGAYLDWVKCVKLLNDCGITVVEYVK